MSKNSHNIEQALKAFQNGEFVIITDDASRENEGDLILSCELATEKQIAFMIRHTSGILCVPLEESRLKTLNIPQMCCDNTDPKGTAFGISVDYAHNTTTGISSKDRHKTIQALVDPNATAADFLRPGHIFPLQAKKEGVLERAGHTEATLDMARLSGLKLGGVLSEIVNDDGSVASTKDLQLFSEKYNIPMISVNDIIHYRRTKERLVELVSEATLPTHFGDFTAKVYRSRLDNEEHIALVKGDITNDSSCLVRVHSECLTGDVFFSKRCDCGNQLELAMEKIAMKGQGVIVYLRGHEGRGIGLAHKLQAYQLQDNGLDTVDANLELGLPVDSREYATGAQILKDLGVNKIQLLTNNPAKYKNLSDFDLNIIERVPLNTTTYKENHHYLLTKKNRLGHQLDLSLEKAVKN